MAGSPENQQHHFYKGLRNLTPGEEKNVKNREKENK